MTLLGTAIEQKQNQKLPVLHYAPIAGLCCNRHSVRSINFQSSSPPRTRRRNIHSASPPSTLMRGNANGSNFCRIAPCWEVKANLYPLSSRIVAVDLLKSARVPKG